VALSTGSPFADAWARLEHRPGIRTLRSPAFRLVLGGVMLAIGAAMLGSLLLRQAAEPSGEFGIDFADYRAASLRMLEGGSPYAPEMLVGPVPAQGIDRYRYPPPFAQLLTPIAVLPIGTASALWLAFQAVSFFVGTWLAASAAGARRSWERAVWTAVVLLYFYPVFDALWKGSVQGPLALATGALLAMPYPSPGAGPGAARLGAGALAGVVAVVRLTPLALVPAILRANRHAAVGVVLGSVGLCVLSAILAPGAWADYAVVVPNLLAGSADYATNLALPAALGRLGVPAVVVDVVRVLSLAVAGALVVASVRLARQATTWPAALACAAAATLLVPAAVWYHYVAILIPLAAFAWVRARPEGRLVLLAAGVLVDVSVAVLPVAAIALLVFAGATVLVARGALGMPGTYERATGTA
jgi:hypothetical protein